MLNSHAVKAIKNRRSIIFHDTMYAKDGKPQYEIRKEGSYYCIYPVNGSNKIGKGFLKEEDAEKKINELNLAESKDSDYRGYKVKDQIIKGFMIYKSGKPNAFTAKNESGEQYEGTMEEIKAKIDAYWVKRDEDVMKQKDAASPALFDNDFEGWKGKAESLGYKVKENKTTGLWEAKEGIAIKGTYNKTKGGRLYLDSKAKDDVMYQGQSYPAKELHRILANKGKVKEFNELSEKEQKERMDNPFALYESGDNIYAVVRRNKVN